MSLGQHEYGNAERRQAQYDAAFRGGIKGGALGAGLSIPTAYILHQRWEPFRHLTLPLKALFVTAATLSLGVISADKSGLKYDRDHYTDEGAQKMRQFRSKEDKEWSELAARDKALMWAKDNKFSIVAGSWVASMGGIFLYIHRQPVPFTEKIVQVRVWAQGLTLLNLVAVAAITTIPSAGDHIIEERQHASDHSWKDFIGSENADPAKGGSNRDQYGQSKPTSSSTGGGKKSQQKAGSEENSNAEPSSKGKKKD